MNIEITFEYAAAWMGTGRYNEDFEVIGEWFQKETGFLRPGKDCRIHSYEKRTEMWKEWQPRATQRMAIWLADQQDKLNSAKAFHANICAGTEDPEKAVRELVEAASGVDGLVKELFKEMGGRGAADWGLINDRLIALGRAITPFQKRKKTLC